MKAIGSTLVLALGFAASGCILLLDTDKLHSDNAGAAGSSSAGASGSGGAGGDAGKGGKGGKGGASGTSGAGGASPLCVMCLGNNCAKETVLCEAKNPCKGCISDPTKQACATDGDYVAFATCACQSCSGDCGLTCGAAGKGGG